MSGVFSKSKTPELQQVEETPQVVDNSEKVREQERGRRKRRGVASQVLAGNDLSGVQTNKKTLGA